MVSMRPVLRRFAAVLATLALVAMLPAPCPCPEEAAAPARGHRCCAPPTGVSSIDLGCCDEHATEADLLTPGPAPMPSPSEVAVARTETVARLEAVPHRSLVVAPSPPPAILRL
jgi:hypothetical protein